MQLTILRSALICSAAATLTATPALAEDTQYRDYLPGEIVVTGAIAGYSISDGSSGTKTPTPLIDVPQTVSVVTTDQLQDQAIRQLGDALRYVPGISMESGEGHRDEVFIRGQETTADFYLDGLRDDAQYYRSLYNVERIEVLKGANALIFGRGGGGGVVNRVSKTAQLTGQFFKIDGSADNFGAFALTADMNQPMGDNVGGRINAAYEEFGNGRDFYEGRFIGISPTITAELGSETKLTATYSYDDDARVTDRGIPSLNGLPLMGFDQVFFGDAQFNQAQSQAHIARARIDHSFSPSLSANASVQFANFDKDYANILPRSTDGADVELSGYRDTTTRENLIGQANLVWQVPTGMLSHTVLAGLEASRQNTQNGRQDARFAAPAGLAARITVPLAQQISLPAISLTAPVRDRDSGLDVLSAYIQDQVSIGDHFQIIAGLRWDRFDLKTLNVLSGSRGDRVDEQISPRFGLIFKPTENLSFYSAYAESFLPQAGDQFVLLSPGDSAFEPEKFTNYEIGAKWLVKPNLFLTAALFRLNRSNSQAPDPSNSGLTVLTGSSRTDGFEISLAGNILDGWDANIGYTYMDGKLRSTTDAAPAGTRLQQLPKHHFAAWNHFEVAEKFSLGFGAIYQAEQFSSFSNSVILPDYWRFDVAAYYKVNENVSFQLNIENLFDADYFASAHGDNNIQPGAPISARAGVRIKL